MNCFCPGTELSLHACQGVERVSSNCSAQPTFRQHVLKSGPSDLRHTEGKQKYNFIAVGVLQEHSAGASGTGQSEEPLEETQEDE